jgi:protein TonB
VPYKISEIDVNASLSNSGGVGPRGTGGSGAINNTRIEDEAGAPPPLPKPSPSPAPKRQTVSLGVLTSKVISKPTPPYPPLAKAAGVQGEVTIQILVDEAGKVISARAVSGNPLLRPAAEQAAYQTRFTPTLLSNQPVKVTGTITFNFILH